MKTKLLNSSITAGISKNLPKFIALFLLVVFFNSCKKQDVIESIPSKKFAQLTEKEKDALKWLGYSIDSITEFREYYVVENDILISKKSLQSSPRNKSDAEISQHHTYNLVSNYSDYNINILVTQSIWSNYQWYAGLQEAVYYWNSLPNSNIKLHLISSSYYSNERIDITIQSDNGSFDIYTAAEATPPQNGKPGNVIYVNTDFRDNVTNYFINSAQAKWNMIHEIGHCLGFRHTNWYLRGEPVTSYGAVHIPNTPDQYNGDASSVMNGGTPYNSCYGNCFSNYDKTAVDYLYPINTSSLLVPYITGSASFNAGNTVYSISYRSGENNINYRWEIIGINGTNYYYEDPENLAGIEVGLSQGNYKIKCTISNGKFNSVIAEKNIMVY